MKATGIVRRIDCLGRVVIPTELRRILKIEEKDALEILVDGEDIVLKKYQPGCQICNSLDDVKEIEGLKLCKECIEKIAKAVV